MASRRPAWSTPHKFTRSSDPSPEILSPIPLIPVRDIHEYIYNISSQLLAAEQSKNERSRFGLRNLRSLCPGCSSLRLRLSGTVTVSAATWSRTRVRHPLRRAPSAPDSHALRQTQHGENSQGAAGFQRACPRSCHTRGSESRGEPERSGLLRRPGLAEGWERPRRALAGSERRSRGRLGLAQERWRRLEWSLGRRDLGGSWERDGAVVSNRTRFACEAARGDARPYPKV